jgi:hypothetical protein
LACFIPSAYADAMESFDGTAEHGKLEFAGLVGTGYEDTSFGLAVAFGDRGPDGCADQIGEFGVGHFEASSAL